MPVYTYRREDGSTFEISQKFLDDPLTVCPTTGQNVARVIQAPGIIFKGSGFYVTDNRGNGSSSASNGTASKETASKESKSENTGETKSETTSATKKAG
jgi:putative FmdB family regulatory protein